jgi:hypothetical protein
MMRAVKPVGQLLCTLALLALSACGGGGGVSGSPAPVSPSSTDTSTLPVDTAPADGTVVVTSGAESTRPGTYTATPGTTGGLSLGGLAVTLQSVETEDLQIAVGLTSEPGKYMLAIVEKGAPQSYGCLGGTWSTEELDALATQTGQTAAACPTGVVVDTTAKQLTLNKVSLPSAPVTGLDGVSTTAGPVLVLSATKLDWSANTLADNTVSVDVGNEMVPAGYYGVNAGLSVTQSTGLLTLDAQTLKTDAVDIGIGIAQEDPSKFILSVKDNFTDYQYACLGGDWTDEEKAPVQEMYLKSVIACPAGVSIDTALHLVKLNKVTLQTDTDPDLPDADPTKIAKITISANLDWTNNTPVDATPAEPAASAP